MSEKKQPKQEIVKLSAIDEDILTVMQGGKELYGLEILDVLNLDSRPFGKLGFGSLYPALNRLEKKGLISWRWGSEEEASGGARRKYFKITGLGSISLRAIQQYRADLAMQTEGTVGISYLGAIMNTAKYAATEVFNVDSYSVFQIKPVQVIYDGDVWNSEELEQTVKEKGMECTSRQSLQQQLYLFFPEDWRGETEARLQRLEKAGCSKWDIRHEQFQILLELLWGAIQVILENLLLPRQKSE